MSWGINQGWAISGIQLEMSNLYRSFCNKAPLPNLRHDPGSFLAAIVSASRTPLCADHTRTVHLSTPKTSVSELSILQIHGKHSFVSFDTAELHRMRDQSGDTHSQHLWDLDLTSRRRRREVRSRSQRCWECVSPDWSRIRCNSAVSKETKECFPWIWRIESSDTLVLGVERWTVRVWSAHSGVRDAETMAARKEPGSWRRFGRGALLQKLLYRLLISNWIPEMAHPWFMPQLISNWTHF